MRGVPSLAGTEKVAPRDRDDTRAIRRRADALHLLRRVNQPGAARGKIFFHLNWDGRGLSTGEIEAPDVAAVLEDDGVLAERGELDVEVLEVGELLGLLRR